MIFSVGYLMRRSQVRMRFKNINGYAYAKTEKKRENTTQSASLRALHAFVCVFYMLRIEKMRWGYFKVCDNDKIKYNNSKYKRTDRKGKEDRTFERMQPDEREIVRKCVNDETR